MEAKKTAKTDVPCPCGSRDLVMEKDMMPPGLRDALGSDPLFFVDCRGCGSTGPPHENEDVAVSRWGSIHGENGHATAAAIREVGAAIVERLDEHNRLTAEHTALLRNVGDAAVTREAEAIQRETERLKLLTTSRDDVLDEVQDAIDDIPWESTPGDPVAIVRGVVERMREEG